MPKKNKGLQCLQKINSLGYNNLPICIAKTQYSFSDDAKNLQCEETFDINTITMTNYNVVFFETEYDETYNSKDNPEMFDENGMFIKERNRRKGLYETKKVLYNRKT